MLPAPTVTALGIPGPTPPPVGAGPPGDPSTMHSEIMALVARFNLDERIRLRLTDTMSRRMNSFSQDIRTLWEVLETARNPPGLLSVKLNEMDMGTFVPRGFPAAGGREEFCG